MEKNNKVNYFQLGASLYTPANHKDLDTNLICGISGARSMVVCTEDAISDSQLRDALDKLRVAIHTFSTSAESENKIIRFIRPRNPETLKEILSMKGIEKIDGFVLPKATCESLIQYKEVIVDSGMEGKFSFMPTLETREVLNPHSLHMLRKGIDSFSEDIACIRIGGNDLMNLLGIKRMPGLTVYETPVRTLIDNIVLEFRSAGYELSAPVFDYIDDRVTLQKEMEQDLNYGFFAKTAIHPSQTPLINAVYHQYLESNSEKAFGVTSEVMKQDRSVYQEDGQMMEITCHSNWASRTVMFYEAMKLFLDDECKDSMLAI